MFSVNMDVSPVQSSSKCASSDFSIERLLSDDTKNREESVEVPDWLCCTRYRPPRLPRAAAVCRARRAGRHARVPFTAAQASALEAAYARAPYLAPPALRALAAALQLRDDRIKIWFQNRRARERREKSVNITPPNHITLPPTTQISFASNSWIPHTRLAKSNESIIPHTRPNNETDIFTNMQRLRESNAERFLNIQNPMNNFSHLKFKEESNEERSDDMPLDVETVED